MVGADALACLHILTSHISVPGLLVKRIFLEDLTVEDLIDELLGLDVIFFAVF